MAERNLLSIAAPPPPSASIAPINYSFADPKTDDTSIRLRHYAWVIQRNIWKILAFVVVCVAATTVVSSRITPIYESVATVDIDRQSPTGVVGQEAVRSTLNDTDQFLSTQVKLIQSDSVLRPVAQRYKLALTPREPDSQNTLADWEEAPIQLPDLKVLRPPNTYLLLIGYRSAKAQLAADVANSIAQSYIEHTYNLRFKASAGLSAFMEKQLEELKAKMERSGAAVAQFERELNVINPEEKTSVLSARLLQLNTEYTNAQADRVKRQVAYESVKSGDLEAAQVSLHGEALRRLLEKLDEAQQRYAQVKEQYGANHPEYRKASIQLAEVQRQADRAKQKTGMGITTEFNEAISREAMLKKALASTKSEFDRVNAGSFQYQALKREAESDKKIYEELIRKIKEAGINASFQNSSIRLADPARRPLRPVYPNKPRNLALAFIFSMVFAVGAALLSDMMDNTIRDPDQIRRTLRTDVIGNLPLVRSWRGKVIGSASLNTDENDVAHKRTALSEQATGFQEAIRSLRNSILVSGFDRRPRTILIGSAMPKEGKTTTAVSLAVAHAHQKLRTLLIDGDLRRPSVHEQLGIPNEHGLSEVLNTNLDWRASVVKIEAYPDLDVLPAGPHSTQAASSVGRILPAILESALTQYDLVVIDAPPFLGFAEPLQMASMVDGVVLISVAGKTNRQALFSTFQNLRRLRANVIGVVINEVHEGLNHRYYYNGYYGKYYTKYYKPAGS